MTEKQQPETGDLVDQLVAQLPTDAANHFRFYKEEIEKFQYIERIDLPLLVEYADTVAEIARHQAIMEIEGHTFESEGRNGEQIKAHPLTGRLRDLRLHQRSLISELGLAPKARAALKIASSGEEESEWDEI